MRVRVLVGTNTRLLPVPVTRNTLLRLIASLPDPATAVPRVVGVGEYARRKGCVYGTVPVDVETHRSVDLLPDREADTLAAWLAERPGIEIVCRDRAHFFAEGATRGAPQTLQVADRWHLWRNLGEAAAKFERGLDAVNAVRTLPWNSGVVEGQVNRIKRLKRQMFGRAGFDLLRKRVLLALPRAKRPHEVDQSPRTGSRCTPLRQATCRAQKSHRPAETKAVGDSGRYRPG